jgi:hypothetical protein
LGTFSFAQGSGAYYASADWYEGTITLRDGTFMNGLIRFNNAAGEIWYKQDEDSEEVIFKENKVSSVTYVDEVTKGTHKYQRFETIINQDMKMHVFTRSLRNSINLWFYLVKVGCIWR